MRLISQDGMIDIPYENSSLSVFCVEYVEPKRTIICCRNSYLKEEEKIAEYSTIKKAVKAMEMLRKVHENNVFYHCTAGSKRFEEAQSILSEEQFRKVTTEYFQFPQDDEIEV